MKIELEFISSSILNPMGEKKKIKYIIDKIKKDKILVTDESLTHEEEARLIEETMKRVNNNFPGIEISTLEESKQGLRDKAILESLFSTGLRIAELVSFNKDQFRLKPSTKDLEIGIIGKVILNKNNYYSLL